jgi:hypothetical protein
VRINLFRRVDEGEGRVSGTFSIWCKRSFLKIFLKKLKIVFCEFESREPEIENEKNQKIKFSVIYVRVRVCVKAKKLCISPDV